MDKVNLRLRLLREEEEEEEGEGEFLTRLPSSIAFLYVYQLFLIRSFSLAGYFVLFFFFKAIERTVQHPRRHLAICIRRTITLA